MNNNMTIFGADLLTILLVVGIVILLTYMLMTLGTAALGVMVIIGVVGLILFGVGFIEVFLGGFEGLADIFADLFGGLGDFFGL